MANHGCTAITATAEEISESMPYKNLGKSGLRVSKLSFGAWVTFGLQVDVQQAFELMKLAYSYGINFFDNAEAYGSGKAEEVMGEAIKLGIEQGVWERNDLVVTTKIFFGTKQGKNNKGLSRKHLIEGTKASLKRLDMDYVDVVFCHRPDPLTPIEETVRAMNFLIDQGLAFYWGTSEWSATELTEAWRHADRLGMIGPICDQAQYNMFERSRIEVEYAPIYKEYGLGLTTWSPLASGILTGKYSKGNMPEGSRFSTKEYAWLKELKEKNSKWQFEKADLLFPIAKELGCTPAQLAVAWCAKNDNVSTVILGATKTHQLEENLAALKILPRLTNEIMAKIDEELGTKPELHGIHQQAYRVRA
eukprot:TRINITY_DN7967_c0_g2_i3.p1 TRINITY_DN7967_c0_g2~~TRINITY_DN7967_c0_g2_i3.p1  ORF type:complete len:362 (+),score=103.85 TRINITY_DN7967_c0_g2_i3:142-1227(+)